MDENDPRSDGNGGYSSSAYDPRSEDSNGVSVRSATDQGINNRNGWTDLRQATWAAENPHLVDQEHRQNLGMSTSTNEADHRSARESAWQRIRDRDRKQRDRDKKQERSERRAEARAAAEAARAEREHPEDPWAPYRDYSAGEAGEVDDMEVHEQAIAQAMLVTQGCEACSSSPWLGTEEEKMARRAVFNSTYAQFVDNGYGIREVPPEARSIPAGPMAAAAKYQEGRTGTKVTEYERAVDELVIQGRVSFYYPGQIPLHTDENLTDTQKLGQSRSLVLVAGNNESYGETLQAFGVPAGSGMASIIEEGAYTGNVIVLNNGHHRHQEGGASTEITLPHPIAGEGSMVQIYNPNNSEQYASVRHEFSHAGEHAIYAEAKERVILGTATPELVEAAAIAKAYSIGRNSYYNIVDISEETPRPSSSNRYVNQHTEFEAHLHQYDDPQQGRDEMAIYIKDRYDVDDDEAARIIDVIENSPVRVEARNKLDEAARILLGE